MKDMTLKQARAEAVKRFGPTGAIRERTPAANGGQVGRGRLARYRCIVGNATIEGQGHTWREAFEDAKSIA